ncbi:MAG: histidine kinase [Chloroflexota bacterium]|nr:MAG: histidine kinase [Chloroflexota bacterium]
MKSMTSFLAKFFGVIVWPQTYLNLIYLLLAFPLGLTYFVLLVTGFSLGVSLLIIWIGLLILPVMFALCWIMAALERQLAIWLLREPVPPMVRPQAEDSATTQGLMAQIGAHLTNPVTWKSILYLVVKFPLGTISFVVLVFLGALSGALLTAPITFPFVPLQVWFTWNTYWQIDTLPEALLAFVIGALVTLISLHILNGLAWVSGRFARAMLGVSPQERVRIEPPLAETGQIVEQKIG